MKLELLEILADPNNGQRLQLNVEHKEGDEITSGALTNNGVTYKIENGIPNFISPSDDFIIQERSFAIKSSNKMKEEIGEAAYRDFFVKQVLGKDKPNLYDLYTRATIKEAVEKMNLTGNEIVLEIGGSTGRDLVKNFVLKGCTGVELEISAFLAESSRVLMDHFGCYYERVHGTMNNLPLANESFDLIFGSATFHHSLDPESVFKEVYRCLKKGGTFLVLNERAVTRLKPSIKEAVRQEDPDAHESAYFTSEWKRFLQNAGFKVNVFRPAFFTYKKIIERHYSKKTPKSFLGKIKFRYYQLMCKYEKFGFVRWLSKNVLFKIEMEFFADVPFNAICKK